MTYPPQDASSVHGYAQKVLAGEIVTGKWIKLACQRFIDDLAKQEDPNFRWRFDEGSATRKIRFFSTHLVHVEDQLCGTPIYLQLWQCFFFGNVFGWVDKTDPEVYRFNDVLLFVSRKNGKTLVCAGIALIMFFGGAPGQQIFSYATKEKQAKIVWEATRRMIMMSNPVVRTKFDSTQREIRYPGKFGLFTFLGRDSKSLDGSNPSLNLADESAQIMDRNLHEVQRSGQGARKTFLNVQLSTAAFDKTTYFFESNETLERVLSGIEVNDRLFGVLYCLDEGDDPFTDEACWIKSNPNLDISVSREWLRQEVDSARNVSLKRASLLVKNFNVWQGASSAWLNDALWRDEKLYDTREPPKGFIDTFITYDLSRTTDLTAVCLWTRYANGFRHAKLQCFVPQDTFNNLPTAYKNIYQRGIDEGVLHLMSGGVIDYRELQTFIEELYLQYKPIRVGYDPYSALQISASLDELGIPVEEVRQSMAKISPAAKEFERLFTKQLIRHEKSEFIAWQIGNVNIYEDINDNILPQKQDVKSHHKIDAVSAMITACHLDMSYPSAGSFFFARV